MRVIKLLPYVNPEQIAAALRAQGYNAIALAELGSDRVQDQPTLLVITTSKKKLNEAGLAPYIVLRLISPNAMIDHVLTHAGSNTAKARTRRGWSMVHDYESDFGNPCIKLENPAGCDSGAILITLLDSLKYPKKWEDDGTR